MDVRIGPLRRLHAENWCFPIGMVEKTESPLDSKEIKPVKPKGNQPWIFTGRTDAEAPTLWPLMWRGDLLEKTLMLGESEGKTRRVAEDEIVRLHHWLNGHESEQTPGDGGGQGNLVGYRPQGHKESGRALATEQQLLPGTFNQETWVSPCTLDHLEPYLWNSHTLLWLQISSYSWSLD